MEENLEQDVETQLQVELNRLKNIIQYIEQAKSSFAQSQKIFENTHAEFIEMSRQQEIFKQSIIKITSDIENNIKNNYIMSENELSKHFLLLDQNAQNLSDIKLRMADINLINNVLLNRQKIIDTNLEKQNSEQNLKIAVLTKQIKSSKTFNYILLALWLITLIISIIK